MNVSVHPNQYLTQPLTVAPNSTNSDLLVLHIVEDSSGSHTTEASVVLTRDMWQQVADQLAAQQVVAGVTLARLNGVR